MLPPMATFTEKREMKSEKKRAKLQNLPNKESVLVDFAVIAVVVAFNDKSAKKCKDQQLCLSLLFVRSAPGTHLLANPSNTTHSILGSVIKLCFLFY